MNLTGYSDSENSEDETENAVPAQSLSKPGSIKQSTKPAFRKVVDRAEPHKIRVQLPAVRKEIAKEDRGDQDGARPAKKPRLGGGFNAMLPAPKRSGHAASGSVEGAPKSLSVGRGVSLKTGAQASFSREVTDESLSMNESTTRPQHKLGNEKHGITGTPDPGADAVEVKLIGNPTMFRPLSVTSKNKKKKKTAAELLAHSSQTGTQQIPKSSGAHKSSASSQVTAETPTKPKVSLFSLSEPEGNELDDSGQHREGDLSEMGLGDTNHSRPDLELGDGHQETQAKPLGPGRQDSAGDDHSLTAIAADLNLTAAEKRQLFGRNSSKANNMHAQALNVVNFNMDQQYAANEAARASGEAAAAAQQSRGVRAIAPGKHNLKQLLNAATGQKEELEDSFAQGRRNKREAGSKYGWS